MKFHILLTLPLKKIVKRIRLLQKRIARYEEVRASCWWCIKIWSRGIDEEEKKALLRIISRLDKDLRNARLRLIRYKDAKKRVTLSQRYWPEYARRQFREYMNRCKEERRLQEIEEDRMWDENTDEDQWTEQYEEEKPKRIKSIAELIREKC